MIKRVIPAAIAILILMQAAAAQQGSLSEADKTRPGKEEILSSMIKSARMSNQQQDSQLNLILKNQSESKTPRSNFLFCIGLAYRGVGKAQTCIAKAYEAGLGVVEDQIEAYVWYAVAQGNKSPAGSTEQNFQSDTQRIKDKLQTAYPFPSDEDLENQLKAQQDRIAQYQSDFKKEKK